MRSWLRQLTWRRRMNSSRKLPDGYETVIGERGARLSAGQAQRLALARAFLKPGGLVILDEPASHLDPDNEARIGQAARLLAPDHTVLLIAHRPETLAYADTVITLQDGEVIESHAQQPRGEGIGDKGSPLPKGEGLGVRALPSLGEGPG